MLRFSIISISIFLIGSINLFAQPEIRAVFTATPPAIDGSLNDDVWKDASVINELFQREPNPGKPVSEKTEFYFLYDHNNIYIGIRCFDDPEGITAKELARDVSLGDDDRVQIILDTYLDGRSGYWFQIGPRGSIGDALVNENGKDFNKSWDGLWDGKAKITTEGWDGELIIPFKTLGFKEGNSTWGLKLIRYIKRKSEASYWPETSLNANKFQVSDAGRITGITDITQGIGLDITPYLTSGVSKKQNTDPKGVLDGGLDAFYHITPSLKASLTVNTDFAQTEVDEKQINLTRFSLFFPEKRDFFLDGANYFTFGINGDSENPQSTQMIPFFSRRIGLDAGGNPVSIKYGGKFTGKVGNWNLGAMHIKDDNQWDNPGYSVGRISRNLGKQSSIGLIGTNGNAFSDLKNTLVGIDLRLASSLLAGNKNISYNLYGLKSFTHGLTGNDISFGTEINYPNDKLNFRLGYLQIGEDFTPGLGFIPRKNIRDFYGGIGIGPRPKNSPVMQIKSGVKYVFISDLKNGGLLTSQMDFNLSDIIFLSGDIISLSAQYQHELLTSDFHIFENFVIPAEKYTFWRKSVTLTSAKRRNLWAATKVGTGSFYSGKRTDWMIQAGYKVIVPVYIGMESDRKWVDLPDGSFVTQIYRLNLNFLFSPNLSWYNFAQYENQTETIGWQSRLQWIIKPGKEIFLTFNSPLIDPLERFKPEVYEARIKAKYTIRF
ncbi:MAG: carbohydrate binding family 9 domain-containing protein [Bacteroidales bacterium]|nr:carbohydrate binding family 9 domain-containing protein [Bacteroidales bacterium]